MNLRYKVLSGFIILTLLLAVAGLWSVYNFHFISNRFNKAMDLEYESVNSSIIMLHALEREDSAMLFSLLGNLNESNSNLQTADSLFLVGLNQARSSTTDKEDENIVSEIENNYKIYKEEWQYLNNSKPLKVMVEWYSTSANVKFNNVKQSVENLLIVNEDDLYLTANELKDLARRATMPGIIAMIAALIFTLMFSYFVHLYFISPVTKIITAVKRYKESGTPIDVKVYSKDEMADLAEGINYLSLKINKNSKE